MFRLCFTGWNKRVNIFAVKQGFNRIQTLDLCATSLLLHRVSLNEATCWKQFYLSGGNFLSFIPLGRHMLRHREILQVNGLPKRSNASWRVEEAYYSGVTRANHVAAYRAIEFDIYPAALHKHVPNSGWNVSRGKITRTVQASQTAPRQCRATLRPGIIWIGQLATLQPVN